MPIILRQNENLVKTVRRHGTFIAPIFFTWPLIILGVILAKYLAGFDFFGYWNWAVSVAALIVVLIILQRLYVWKNNVLIITSQRVIKNEQYGFFSKTVIELLYSDIREISYSKRGMSASLYGYGDVKIRTAANSEIIIEKIADPAGIVELINRVRQKLRI